MYRGRRGEAGDRVAHCAARDRIDHGRRELIPPAIRGPRLAAQHGFVHPPPTRAMTPAAAGPCGARARSGSITGMDPPRHASCLRGSTAHARAPRLSARASDLGAARQPCGVPRLADRTCRASAALCIGSLLPRSPRAQRNPAYRPFTLPRLRANAFTVNGKPRHIIAGHAVIRYRRSRVALRPARTARRTSRDVRRRSLPPTAYWRTPIRSPRSALLGCFRHTRPGYLC